MRIRNILTCVLISLMCLGVLCPKAADAAQTPQEFVKAFYEWYIIKHYEHHAILKDEKLPEYVDASLIEELEKKGPSDLYYFIQFGSSTTVFKECRIVVKDALKMTDDVFVVPVTFKGEKFESTVIAYVKKVDSVFKITSVSDAYTY
ncbi:hypothetical protein [Desulfovibrio desulfuricans]|uniref:hypothetical protein n=1 Tax=Desulfovibrio desulfuricans TaxID=876 RepID=UPI0003B700B0|nr:hypothetical protein [Desulfovibrio desulfuricans]